MSFYTNTGSVDRNNLKLVEITGNTQGCGVILENWCATWNACASHGHNSANTAFDTHCSGSTIQTAMHNINAEWTSWIWCCGNYKEVTVTKSTMVGIGTSEAIGYGCTAVYTLVWTENDKWTTWARGAMSWAVTCDAVRHELRAQLTLMWGRVNFICIVYALGARSMILAGWAERHEGGAEYTLAHVIKTIVIMTGVTVWSIYADPAIGQIAWEARTTNLIVRLAQTGIALVSILHTLGTILECV